MFKVKVLNKINGQLKREYICNSQEACDKYIYSQVDGATELAFSMQIGC